MRLNRFDLNLLVVLDVLLEERNVTRASRRLHISQSGASAALNRLREHFDDELLVPLGRQLTLTPLALSLVGPVREALEKARAAIACAPTFEPASADRRFVVCASDYVAAVLLAPAAQRIAKVAPGISLDIRSPPKDIAGTFDRSAADLVVLPEQYGEGLPHPQARLMDDGHVCVVWAHHPSLGSDISLEQYLSLGHVVVRLGDERSLSFEEWFLPRQGQTRRIACVVDTFSALPWLVIGTERIATLHRRLANRFASMLPLRSLELPFEIPRLVEMMIWPRHLQADPAHAWLREQLLGCARELDAVEHA
jgi:DNA-binding transcriptional LysR family regulator